MKILFISAAASLLLTGCAMTETRTAGGAGLREQPQTSIAGNGSLMPGAYGSRQMQAGQFTGQERTRDQMGQGFSRTREANDRQFLRSGGERFGHFPVEENEAVGGPAGVEIGAGADPGKPE